MKKSLAIFFLALQKELLDLIITIIISIKIKTFLHARQRMFFPSLSFERRVR
jgi:hypothetical protein